MPSKQADPADLRRALNAVAIRQHGYFTARQALAAGYSYQAQRYHVQHGNWTRVDRGIFRLPDWPVSDNDTFVFWALWSGDRAVISHESALTLHDVGDANPAKVHLTVPANFRAANPAVVLHKKSLAPGDIEERPDVRFTTIERTLLDVAAGDLSQEQLDTAVSDALEAGLISRRQLRARSDRHGDHAALRIERSLAAANQ
jgi:predicted transcriptional regulator of viral defense system